MGGILDHSRQLDQVVLAYSLEGGRRPAQEPVNRCAVDERGVLSEVVLQLGARWAHEEEHVQVPLASLSKESVSRLLRCVFHLSLSKLLLNLVMDLLLVFGRKEGGQLAHVEDVIDVLYELLFLDLFVGE